MSDLKEKKFGFVVHPPHPMPCNPYPFPCPVPGPIPPGIHTQDWLSYINSYIDVRARQMYEKLKEQLNKPSTPPSVDNPIRDYVLLKEKYTNKVYMVWIEDGVLHTGFCGMQDGSNGDLIWGDETGNSRAIKLNS